MTKWLWRLLGLPVKSEAPRGDRQTAAGQETVAEIAERVRQRYVQSEPSSLDLARNKIGTLVEERIDTLARRRIELLKIDRYGVVDARGWNEEVQYFADNVIRPVLSDDEASAVAQFGLGRLMTELLEDPVRARVEEIEAQLSFSPSMSPEEFERWCRDVLRAQGWKAENTPLTGDQGADVLAEKSGIRVVLQCKLYSSPVGNKAVQEAFSARSHYGARLAVVVTNAGFTPSAEALARTTGSLLVSHLDLGRLDQLIRARGIEIEVGPAPNSGQVTHDVRTVSGRRPSLPR